jgi:hydroxymethylpyrimidine/phosphomethylpyrimidine kinase
MKPPIALTIAGSDSGGGAGIQADLKTFSALGVYGCSVIAALTAQNTRGVTGVFDVPPAFVTQQIDAVFDDIAVDAVKIGMLGRADTIEAVACGLERHRPRHVVLDPVMVAKSGDRLLQADAMAALRDRLVPLASVVTPNLPEAAALLGRDGPARRGDMEAMAAGLRRLGAGAVLLKGGHLEGGGSPDLLLDDAGAVIFEAVRIETKNTHGTGCTLSSAIAALLARGAHLREAVREAKDYVGAAIRAGADLEIGSGHGPVHHFHAIWKEADRRPARRDATC